jgi:hypothetical protein
MNKVFIGVLITTGALIFTLFKAVTFFIKLGIKNPQRIKIRQLMDRLRHDSCQYHF